MRDTSKRSSPATASSHSSSRVSAPGSGSIRRWGASPTGMNVTRSSSSWTSASCAQIRCPMCGGLNAPPRIPTRNALLADLAGALDHVLEGGQLTDPDRAAGVQLLGRVADLRAHPEHAAVGEAGGGVDVDACRVDALGE